MTPLLLPVTCGAQLSVWMKRIETWVSECARPPLLHFLDKQKLPPFFHAEPPGLWPHTWDVSSWSIWLTCLSTLCLLLLIGIRGVVNVCLGRSKNCSTTWRFSRHTPVVFTFVWRCRGPGWKLMSWVGSNMLVMPWEIHPPISWGPQLPPSPWSLLSHPTMDRVVGMWGRGWGRIGRISPFTYLRVKKS